MTERKLDISPLGDCHGQIRPEGFVWEGDRRCYRTATQHEIAKLQPVNLEGLRAKLPREVTKNLWARKMGPQ